MSDILSLLSSTLGGQSSQEIGNAIGSDPAKTQNALAAALPLLLSGLARNASQPDGAQALLGALQRDHDGSALDNLSGVIGGGGNAAGILGHVFGAREPQARAAVAQAGGLDSAQAGKLLLLAAPLVMGALGKLQRDRALDANGLAGFLGGEHQALSNAQPGLMGMAQKLLDKDGDGDVTHELAGMVGKLFGR